MRRTPYEEGNPASKILILAEAPGRTEIRKGQPLVGPSGHVFADCLKVAGLRRSECYILNVWPDQVVKDHKEDIYDGTSRLLWHHKTGFTGYGLGYASETLAKIEDSQANIILALGRVPFSLLVGEVKPLMKWRGSILWSKDLEKKYIPTVHPAATLHGTYLWRYLIQNDMAKARSEMDSPELKLPERQILIRPTLDEALDFMATCHKQGLFATDIEVVNRQVSCFSLALSPFYVMTIPLVDSEGKNYWDIREEASIWHDYASLMSDPKVMKVNQNIVGFDIPFLLMQNHIRTTGPLGDPMIAHSIMYPHFPKGLDFIASYHTKEPYWKDEGRIWKSADAAKVPWETFQRYCAKDAAVALEAWYILADEMTKEEYWATYHMTVEMADALTYMSIRGLAVNTQGISERNIQTSQEIEEKQARLDELAGRPLKANSSKDCREYFYGELGLKPYLGYNGNVTTDDKAMARIVRRAAVGSQEAKLVQEIRALRKLKGTYLETELDKDGRLRCSWNPRGTWTGRLSSSKTIFGTGMDLQNLHPAYKPFIVSDHA
jgi:uracil-DNA glycosylase